MNSINRKIKILIYADVIWYLGEGMLGPLFAVFTERVGGDILDVTWAWATYLVISGVLIFFFGKISDRIVSKEKLLIGGYFLNAVFTFSYLFVSNTLHLTLVQVGLGVAAAMATPTWDAVYSKHEDKKLAGLEWGLADGLSQFVSGVAILLGGILVSLVSFEALFLTMGVIQTVAAIVVFQLTRARFGRQ